MFRELGGYKRTTHSISGAATIRNRPRLRGVCSSTDQLCGERAVLSTDANAEVAPCSRRIQGVSIYVGRVKKDESAVGSGRNSATVRTTTDLGGARQRISQLHAAPGRIACEIRSTNSPFGRISVSGRCQSGAVSYPTIRTRRAR